MKADIIIYSNLCKLNFILFDIYLLYVKNK